MQNSGKQLEQLIKEIEELFLPKGFEVLLRDKVFNEDGVQIAEFDIIIKGNLGSSSIKWLIECRDRPSDGAAPGSWIEQLVGRKSRFNFDKVIAVSTTGFTKGAKDYAEKSGIILRTVKKITDVSSDFRIREFNYMPQQVNIVGSIELTPIIPVNSLNNLKSSHLLIKLKNEENFQTITDFVITQVNLNPVNALMSTKLRFDFWCNELIDFVVDDKWIQLRKIIIPIEVCTLNYKNSALTMNIYSEGERIIGEEVVFPFNLPTEEFSISILNLNKSAGKTVMYLKMPDNHPDINKIITTQLQNEDIKE